MHSVGFRSVAKKGRAQLTLIFNMRKCALFSNEEARFHFGTATRANVHFFGGPEERGRRPMDLFKHMKKST